MAAPMTSAAPSNGFSPTKLDGSRSWEIKKRKDALTRKLQAENRASQKKALNSIDSKKGGSKSYNVKSIPGKEKGFTDSDFGVGAGAGIPYQITNSKGTASKPKPGKKSGQRFQQASKAKDKAAAVARRFQSVTKTPGK